MAKSDFIPPAILPLLKSLTGRHYGYVGDFANWENAVAKAPRYTTNLTVYEAMIARLKPGEWEPGFTFLVVLSGLLLLKQPARVLDFGGSLGIAYFKTQMTMPDLIETWRVVDLPQLMNFGREKYANEQLNFFNSIEEARRGFCANIILCCGTLQYLDDPYLKLEELAALQASVIVLDRTPIGPKERFMTQKVPPWLGGQAFPVRVLDEKRISPALKGYRRIVEHFTGPVEAYPPAEGRHVAQIWVKDI